MFHLPAGKYVLQVSPPRSETQAGQFYADTPSAYYPGTPVPSQALALDLRWGQEITRADTRMPRSQTYAITGALWDASMEGPCVKCIVQAVQHDGAFNVTLPQTARIARNGSFILRGLFPGDYSIVARQGSAHGQLAATRASIRNQHVENLRLTLGIKQPVTGEIVLENPPPGAFPPDSMPLLTPAGMPEWWPRAEGKLNVDRTFAIAEVPPGLYRFELNGLPPGAYLSAVRLGGQTLPNSELVVAAEAGLSGVQAVVAFDSGTVQGKVPGTQKPVRIVLAPAQRGNVQAQISKTAADGSFSMGSVPPGSYTIHAVPATASWQVFDPAVQGALAPYGRQIELASNATVSVEIPLAPEM